MNDLYSFTCIYREAKLIFADLIKMFLIICFTCFRYIHLYVIEVFCLLGSFSGILSCDVHACLTWEAKKEKITFKCKISHLRFEVHFYNFANEDQGFCLSPFPASSCISSNNVISQNLQTNTTILVIQRHVDSRLNGPWECRHGTKRGAAFVNVTIIQQGNTPSFSRSMHFRNI